MTPKTNFALSRNYFRFCNKSSGHFSIVTEYYGTANTEQAVTLPLAQRSSKEPAFKIASFSV